MRKFITFIFEKLAEKLGEKEPPVSVFEEDKMWVMSHPKVKSGSKKSKQKEEKGKGRTNLPQELLPLVRSAHKSDFYNSSLAMPAQGRFALAPRLPLRG